MNPTNILNYTSFSIHEITLFHAHISINSEGRELRLVETIQYIKDKTIFAQVTVNPAVLTSDGGRKTKQKDYHVCNSLPSTANILLISEVMQAAKLIVDHSPTVCFPLL